MKKLVTLLLALLLSLSLTVPAMAAGFTMLQGETLSGPWTYDDMVVIAGNVTAEKGAVITFNNQLNISGSLTVESGASLTTNGSLSTNINYRSSMTIQSGATVTMNALLCIKQNAELKIYGRLDGKGMISVSDGSLLLLPGGEVDIVREYEHDANYLVSQLQAKSGEDKIGVKTEQVEGGYRVTAHGHDFVDGVCDICGLCLHETWTDGVCDNCGYSCPHEKWTEDGVCTVCGVSAPAINVSPENAESGMVSPGWRPLAAFTLSGGNRWIIAAGAGVILAVVAAVVIHKKRKN